MTDGDRAIVVAIELLRDRVTQLPLAIAQAAAQAAADANRTPPPGGRPPDRTGTAAAREGVVLPVLYSLAVGLAAASEVVFAKLVPALEGFNRFVIGTMVPGMTRLAETVGRATQALMWLADSKLGKLAAGGIEAGGPLGALNRLTGGTGIAEREGDSLTAYLKSAHRAADDLIRLLPGGESAAGGVNRLRESVFGVDAYGGRGVRAGESTAAGATGRARSDVLREMMLSFGARPAAGTPGSLYSRTQLNLLSQTPFERRMLEMMQKAVTALTHAEAGGGPGTFTGGGDPGALPAWMRSRGFRITGG
jgi:hypothetical protein